MPGASLLAVIDDIASVLDDVAVRTKVATKKTAGVLGDDLALNAQQVAGVNVPIREPGQAGRTYKNRRTGACSGVLR